LDSLALFSVTSLTVSSAHETDERQMPRLRKVRRRKEEAEV